MYERVYNSYYLEEGVQVSSSPHVDVQRDRCSLRLMEITKSIRSGGPSSPKMTILLRPICSQ